MSGMADMIALIRAIRMVVRATDACVGTPGAYAYETHGCRCDACVRIHNTRCKRLRRRRKAAIPEERLGCAYPANTPSTAYQYGCRCDRCRNEMSERNRRAKKRRQDKESRK